MKFKDGGSVEEGPIKLGEAPEGKTGTSILWKPDFSIFDKEDSYDHDLIADRLETLAYLNKGIEFVFIDEVNNVSKTFVKEEGILSWVKDMNFKKKTLHDVLFFEGEGTVRDRKT